MPLFFRGANGPHEVKLGALNGSGQVKLHVLGNWDTGFTLNEVNTYM